MKLCHSSWSAVYFPIFPNKHSKPQMPTSDVNKRGYQSFADITETHCRPLNQAASLAKKK